MISFPLFRSSSLLIVTSTMLLSACSSGSKPVLLPDGYSRTPINAIEVTVADSQPAVPAQPIEQPEITKVMTQAPALEVAQSSVSISQPPIPSPTQVAMSALPAPLAATTIELPSKTLSTTFRATPGDRLSRALRDWLSAGGWTLSWQANGNIPGKMRDFVLSDNLEISGDLQSILSRLLEGRSLAAQYSVLDKQVLVTNTQQTKVSEVEK